jgi:hypothetical protein
MSQEDLELFQKDLKSGKLLESVNVIVTPWWVVDERKESVSLPLDDIDMAALELNTARRPQISSNGVQYSQLQTKPRVDLKTNLIDLLMVYVLVYRHLNSDLFSENESACNLLTKLSPVLANQGHKVYNSVSEAVATIQTKSFEVLSWLFLLMSLIFSLNIRCQTLK